MSRVIPPTRAEIAWLVFVAIVFGFMAGVTVQSVRTDAAQSLVRSCSSALIGTMMELRAARQGVGT